jgi:small subunit ribosomal protein S4
MGRETGAKCKLCRREGMKLFLKGRRCYTSKCAIETGRPAPGVTAGRRPRKTSDYGVQLREKQRLRRFYGLREGQFRLFFDRAAARRGVTGETLLQLLELRLDNIVYRLGFASSRAAARQLVCHNHVRVNDRKATVPSMILKEGSVITVRDKANSREYCTLSVEATDACALTEWLTLDKDKLQGTVLHVPSRDEIAPVMNEQLVVELYSK